MFLVQRTAAAASRHSRAASSARSATARTNATPDWSARRLCLVSTDRQKTGYTYMYSPFLLPGWNSDDFNRYKKLSSFFEERKIFAINNIYCSVNLAWKDCSYIAFNFENFFSIIDHFPLHIFSPSSFSHLYTFYTTHQPNRFGRKRKSPISRLMSQLCKISSIVPISINQRINQISYQLHTIIYPSLSSSLVPRVCR